MKVQHMPVIKLEKRQNGTHSVASGIYLNTFPLSLSLQLIFKSVVLHVSSCCTCPGPPTGNQTQSVRTTSQTFREEYVTQLKHNVCDDISGA